MMRTSDWLRPTVHLLAALPLIWAVWQFLLVLNHQTNALGANPVEALVRFLGLWALRLLLITLAVTPLVRLFGLRPLMKVRRAIGLWAFAYAVVHLATFMVFDLELSLSALWQEIVKRKFITFGMAALALLLPLAITSTRSMILRLGARRWQLLHRLIYVAGFLAALHFLFLRKGNQPEPKIYLVILGLLLVARLPVRRWRLAATRH